MRFLLILIFILGFTSIKSYSQSDFIKNTFQGSHNLRVFHDYDLGMNYAKQIKKPVLLDFSGWGCVNWRKMEQLVWSAPEVLEILREKLVIISLFVDDKTSLTKSEQKIVRVNNREINVTTYGNKWAVKQMIEYKTNTQPFYIMLNHKGEHLKNGPGNYERHKRIEKFKAWLQIGINENKYIAKNIMNSNMF